MDTLDTLNTPDISDIFHEIYISDRLDILDSPEIVRHMTLRDMLDIMSQGYTGDRTCLKQTGHFVIRTNPRDHGMNSLSFLFYTSNASRSLSVYHLKLHYFGFSLRYNVVARW